MTHQCITTILATTTALIIASVSGFSDSCEYYEESYYCIENLSNSSGKIQPGLWEADYISAELEAQSVWNKSTALPATSIRRDDSFLKPSWNIYIDGCYENDQEEAEEAAAVFEAYLSMPYHENVMSPAAVYLEDNLMTSEDFSIKYAAVIWVMENDEAADGNASQYNATFFAHNTNVISRSSFASQVLRCLQHLYKYGNIAPVSLTAESFWLHGNNVLKISPVVEMKFVTKDVQYQNREDLAQMLKLMQEDDIVTVSEELFLEKLLSTDDIDTLLTSATFLLQ